MQVTFINDHAGLERQIIIRHVKVDAEQAALERLAAQTQRANDLEIACREAAWLWERGDFDGAGQILLAALG